MTVENEWTREIEKLRADKKVLLEALKAMWEWAGEPDSEERRFVYAQARAAIIQAEKED